MPIVLAPCGKKLKITNMNVEGPLRRRLEQMGLTVGSETEVLQSERGGVVLRVKEGKLALDGEIAGKILVEVAERK